MQWNPTRNLRLVPIPKNTVIRPRFDIKKMLWNLKQGFFLFVSVIFVNLDPDPDPTDQKQCGSTTLC
jgi:hypothetical protein